MGDYRIEKNVAYWNSSDRCVPIEYVEKLNIPVNVDVQQKAIDEENEAFLREYRKNPPQYSEETLFEMRAAFGKGEKVVNVITGEEIIL